MLYLATNSGIVRAERKADWQVIDTGLTGHTATAVIARGSLILAGTMQGIYCSEDGGNTWRAAESGPGDPHIRWLEWRDEPAGSALAGTEPAGIYYSNDSGNSWQACPEVARLRDRFGWSLPYSPEAGCVRGFATHGTRAYAAVEVGGVLVSGDGGQTWQLAPGSDGRPEFRRPPTPLIHPDVHSILVHPSSPDQVYAPTGGGFYRSRDGGVTWRFLYDCYCRAAWADAADPEHIVLGPASGVDRGGRIEETRDGGSTWQPASAGLPVPWDENMVERFLQLGDELLAVLADGSLYASPLQDFAWRPILSQVKWVNAAAAA
jgi:photosystem II stability/assembly factor-like uncharacterized protein